MDAQSRCRLWWWIVGLILVCGGGVYLLLSPAPVVSESALHLQEKVQEKVQEKSQEKSQKEERTHPAHWSEFAKKFGKSLKPEFNDRGQLLSIQGALNGDAEGISGFNPENSQQVIARAREVVAAAGPLIGIVQDWPLGDPQMNSSKLSAQVYFSQTYQGMPVAPVGSIKVDLGGHGELLGLYSNYAVPVKVVNHVVLKEEDAKTKALLEVPSRSAHIETGSKLIWVQGTEGYYAYQFLISGRVCVVDAENGRILSNRDKRQR